jgi:hypothetical protein
MRANMHVLRQIATTLGLGRLRRLLRRLAGRVAGRVVGLTVAFALIGTCTHWVSLAHAQVARAPEPGKVTLDYLPGGLTLQAKEPGLSFDDFEESFVYTARNRRNVFVYATGVFFDDGKNQCGRNIPFGVLVKPVSLRINGKRASALYLRGVNLYQFLFPDGAFAKPNQPHPVKPISALLNCKGHDVAVSLGTVLSADALARRVENATKADPKLVMTEWHAPGNTSRETLAWLGDNRSVTVETFWDQRTPEGLVFFGNNRTTVKGTAALIEQDGDCTSLEWIAQPGARVRLQGCRISAVEVRKIADGITVAPLG